MPEFWLSTVAGLQEPVIPLSDVAGNAGTAAPAQMVNEVPKLKAGVILGLTVTVKVVVVAHCPAPGVNVYTAEALLSTTAGFQLPVIPLSDVVGNAGTAPPAHMVNELPKLKDGGILGATVTVNVVFTAH